MIESGEQREIKEWRLRDLWENTLMPLECRRKGERVRCMQGFSLA
jgi:hypothetical protein